MSRFPAYTAHGYTLWTKWNAFCVLVDWSTWNYFHKSAKLRGEQRLERIKWYSWRWFYHNSMTVPTFNIARQSPQHKLYTQYKDRQRLTAHELILLKSHGLVKIFVGTRELTWAFQEVLLEE